MAFLLISVLVLTGCAPQKGKFHAEPYEPVTLTAKEVNRHGIPICE